MSNLLPFFSTGYPQTDLQPKNAILTSSLTFGRFVHNCFQMLNNGKGAARCFGPMRNIPLGRGSVRQTGQSARPCTRNRTMNDILHRLDALRRPRLLIRTARIGAEEY
ncbi:MAG: DUF6477 family protein, partial [Paracoccaceae bacterium]|nr:DUF6477 family protein [Paracoccaceae bacterium]